MPPRSRVALQCRGRAHDRVAHALHDGLHVGEVAVDDAGDGDDVGNALHALPQDVIGHAERFEEAGILRHGQQFLVRDDDGRVDRVHELVDAALRLLHAAFAFKGKWLGDDGDGQSAHFAGERRDDRSRAGPSASAEAGGDKDHVCSFESFDDLVGIFQRGLASDFRIRARAQAVGELDAELNLDGSTRHAQRLQVSVCGDELNAFHAGVDHAVDGIAAAATNADDLDLGIVAGFFVKGDANVGVILLFHMSLVRFGLVASPSRLRRAKVHELYVTRDFCRQLLRPL